MLAALASSSTAFQVTCQVENVGSMDGDEVVMVYHKVSDKVRR